MTQLTQALEEIADTIHENQFRCIAIHLYQYGAKLDHNYGLSLMRDYIWFNENYLEST